MKQIIVRLYQKRPPVDILGVTEDGRLRTISGMWAKDEDIRRLLKYS